jgi:uncharacterized membrane protein
MKTQRGSVSMIFLFSLLALLGFAAMALDLSRLYAARETLQTAADAAALAGARELDNTVQGTLAAVATAQSVLSQYRLSLEGNAPIDLSQAVFHVASCPDGTCASVSATDSSATTGVTDATGLTFLEVDTGNQPELRPWFAQIFSLLGPNPSSGLTPFGNAVAGITGSNAVWLYR